MTPLEGIDCSTPLTAQAITTLTALDKSFAMRYLVPDGYSKRITIAEAQALTDAGWQIGCVFETTAGRAQGGAANGQADGALACECAEALQMPQNGVIFFAVDYDAQPADMDAIEAYLTAAKQETTPYPTGVYGSRAVIDEMAARGACVGFWQTFAWSAGGRSQYATIYQYQNDLTMAGIGVDLNNATSLTGLWNYSGGGNMPENGNTPSTWAAAAVAKAIAKGIIKGDDHGDLKLQDPVTRESLMVFFDRLNLLG